MERHFVTFYSPGTFVAETSEHPVESWDTDAAVKIAFDVVERYGARPYGFKFSTRTRADDELDSKVSKTSGIYYLGGKVETIDEVRARNDPNERILLSNMECNGYDRIIVNTNSWKWTQPLRKDDVLLDVELPPRKTETAA